MPLYRRTFTLVSKADGTARIDTPHLNNLALYIIIFRVPQLPRVRIPNLSNVSILDYNLDTTFATFLTLVNQYYGESNLGLPGKALAYPTWTYGDPTNRDTFWATARIWTGYAQIYSSLAIVLSTSGSGTLDSEIDVELVLTDGTPYDKNEDYFLVTPEGFEIVSGNY